MKLFETLEKQLQKENDFVTDDGELKKWVVLNKAQNFDARLIELLLDDQDLKAKFFIEVKGVLVFKQNLFVQFLEQKNYLNDSYTQYKNKVGLTIDGKYLKQRNEVALVWPFKDCILEGGQSREEDKRQEIFFNEILAQDEITQLLDPKVLTNAKVYDKDGQQDFKKFNRDAEINKKRGLPENTITDNLIIKGNNLLALHSLKKEFSSNIKLIYIDPPYNTGNDGFKYNDNFNHSTWLTFMKNRLTVARELLKDDGVIFVQCDDNEQAYLKVLMDDVFGRDNFIGNFIWKNKLGGANDSNILVTEHEYTTIFSKNIQFVTPFTEANKDNGKYLYEDEFLETRGKYAIEALYRSSIQFSKSLFYPIDAPDGTKIYPNESDKNSTKHIWRWSKDTFEKKKEQGRVEFKKTKNGWRVFSKQYFLLDDDNKERRLKIRTIIDFIGNRQGTEHIKTMFNKKNFNNPKPEQILELFIKIATQPNDLVLDFHLGSGTTAAVAHKMNRQYIGIEQMDYIETVAVERLKKVIGKNVKKADELLASLEFDTGGISKSVAWKGGGAFTYLELKKHNQTFIEQIEQAKDSKSLLKIWQEMKAKSFLNYNVDLKKQEEHIEEFQQLELSQQKEHLLELLDKNQLYVNLSSINDKDFAVSEIEKQITKDFYN